ncbi:MAG TPA: hypothetical protein VNH11_24450 [Pirellulales bacterium]|nr:hypothetical protein [Pirellulales bacterium]
MSTNRIASLLPPRDGGDTLVRSMPRATQVARPRFSCGSRVRVGSGVFAGVEGTVASYCSGSRLIIDVEINIQGVTLEIDERLLEPLIS